MGTDHAISEDASKDLYFQKVADVANQMIDAHGKEFAMGVLILAARFIAEDKPLKISRGDH